MLLPNLKAKHPVSSKTDHFLAHLFTYKDRKDVKVEIFITYFYFAFKTIILFSYFLRFIRAPTRIWRELISRFSNSAFNIEKMILFTSYYRNILVEL